MNQIQIRMAQGCDLSALFEAERLQSIDEQALRVTSVRQQAAFFSQLQLQQLINEQQVVIAEENGKLVGYLLSGNWARYKHWALQMQALRCYQKQNLFASSQSCHYGPVWVAKAYRRQGISQQMRHLLREQLAGKYQTLVAIIAQDNEPSLLAHQREMKICDHFEFEGSGFYLLQQKI